MPSFLLNELNGSEEDDEEDEEDGKIFFCFNEFLTNVLTNFFEEFF